MMQVDYMVRKEQNGYYVNCVQLDVAAQGDTIKKLY